MTATSAIPATNWRLPDDACALLAALVEEHQPELIVECGSGRSTVALADATTGYGGHVVALEHLPQYFTTTMRMIAASGLRHSADVRFARLEPHGEDLLSPTWYARHAWDDLHAIGMLVVDGPPGAASRYARAPALPLLRERLLPGCVVVLDDVDRDAEEEIWRQWGITGTTFAHAKASLAYGTVA